MSYYIFPYIFAITGFIILYIYEIRSTFFTTILCLLPSILIVILRGNVGTDTYTYLGYFKELIKDINYDSSFEKGFIGFSVILINLGLNERQCIAIIGLATTIILAYCFSSSTEKFTVFILLLYPIFFYDMTMNGLRYGLAFALSTLAIHNLIKDRLWLFILYSLLAASIQISSILILIIFLTGQFSFKHLSVLFILSISLIYVINYFWTIDLSYFYSKQDMYKDLVAPEGLSGLSPLILFLLIYFCFLLFYEGKIIEIQKQIHIILILELLSFILSKISYSGLRFQMLFLFALMVFVSNNIDLSKNRFKITCCYCIISMISFIITLKHFNYYDAQVLSPFLPYTFFWNEIN